MWRRCRERGAGVDAWMMQRQELARAVLNISNEHKEKRRERGREGHGEMGRKCLPQGRATQASANCWTTCLLQIGDSNLTNVNMKKERGGVKKEAAEV